MSFGKTVPQAYTKETLRKAFDWLAEQGEDVRNQIHSADHLIDLYLKAVRSGMVASQVSHTQSQKTFQSELKNLAKDLNSFESVQGSFPLQEVESLNQSYNQQQRGSQASAAYNGDFSQSFSKLAQQLERQKGQQNKAVNLDQAITTKKENPLALKERGQFPQSHSMMNWEQLLDDKTYKIVKDAQTKLNLSSPDEALRLLVTFGYRRLKEII